MAVLTSDSHEEQEGTNYWQNAMNDVVDMHDKGA